VPTPTAVVGIARGFHWSLSVYLHDISKTAAARITKLDVEMFHHESWKPIYFGVRKPKVKVTRHTNSAGVGFALLRVFAFSGFVCIGRHSTSMFVVD